MPVTKHTPGPWMPHHDKGRLYVETHRDDVICMVAKGLGTQEDQANANLIAAAPELLEALQEMVAGDAEAIAEADALGVPFPDEMLTAYRRAVAAIYKATGGTPCQ